MNRRIGYGLISMLLCGYITGAQLAHADAVTDWNAIAVQTLAPPPPTAPPRPGPIVFLDLAIVQAAVHDAVQAFDKRFEPYHVTIRGVMSQGSCKRRE